MAAHGIKINDKEFQKIIDNELARQIRKVATAGKKAMDELSFRGIDEWYMTVNSSHNYSSIPNSIKVEKGPIRQDRKTAWCDITMYADEEQYLALTEDVYNIYGWADRHKKQDAWAADFVLDLQWNQNVVGLPSPYAHLAGDGSLKSYMEKFLKLNWDDTVNKYL